MGLDTTHNCWHGAYSSFARFRKSLAIQIGIDLDDYFGYGGMNPTKNLQDIEHELMPLFNHSDCDGKLTIKECKSLIIGFNKILENFKENNEYDFDFKERILQFKEGCELAVRLKQQVKFQ